MIKIIFLGDIIGRIGRRAVSQYLPKIRKQYKPDLVIANVENLAHGIGFTRQTLAELKTAGVNFFTSGNHAWSKNGADEILDDVGLPIIRPANYSAKKSGFGYKQVDLSARRKLAKKISQNKLMVVNLLGRVFISEEVTCPFKQLDKIINKHKKSLFIVDFHAEATSEKIAFGHYFDGRVAAILGTHTHVPTADQTILPQGTGYVTDVGMIGYYDSVIGANKQRIIETFLNRAKGANKHDLPISGLCQFNAIYLEINAKTQKTVKIKRLDKIININ